MATEETMKVTDEQNTIILEDVQSLLPCYEEFVEDVLEQFMNENTEVSKMFSWADDDKNGTDQRQHPRFKRHAKAIGTALCQCLSDLNGIKQHEERLNFLGNLHNKKNVQYHYYEKLGGCIVQQVEQRVGPSKWDEERKNAWVKAYEIITFYMIVRFWMGNYGTGK
ncbi:uncharacterized protein LOC142348368 [Convolutriloba macropyga]|uniref:uncharacterized protein LOC142348368 n=1 Tax=Convolutriloba macropyga TaxID=536237 RepID=UPI003F528A81